MNNKEVLMEKELENKRKLTKEVKENMNKMIFINLNIAILFMLIMIGINIAYLNVSSEKFILFIKLFSILSVFFLLNNAVFAKIFFDKLDLNQNDELLYTVTN